jgi:hypothetical protein
MEERPALFLNFGLGGRRPGCSEHPVPHGLKSTIEKKTCSSVIKNQSPLRICIYVSQTSIYTPDSHLAREHIIREKETPFPAHEQNVEHSSAVFRIGGVGEDCGLFLLPIHVRTAMGNK